MFEFPKQQRVSNLISEAETQVPYLNDSYNSGLNQAFDKIKTLLNSTPTALNQKAFMLGLARHQVLHAEKQAVSLMIGDESISVEEMSHLVRVRLICAELSNLLAQGLEELKNRPRARVQ